MARGKKLALLHFKVYTLKELNRNLALHAGFPQTNSFNDGLSHF